MAEGGWKASDPLKPDDSDDQRRLVVRVNEDDPPSAEEIEFALAHIDCAERTNLVSRLQEVTDAVEAEYVEKHGLDEIAEVFGKGVKVEVGDLLPSVEYAKRLKRVPKAWDKAFEVNAGESDAVRASCVEFVLAGLYASDRISRSTRHGRISYET